MSKTANDLVSVLQGWIGYSEGNGKFKQIIDLYNSHSPLARGYKVKYTDEWCATTVSAASIKAGMTGLTGTECSCEKFIQIFKDKGIWIEDGTITPQPGDIILYNWDDGTQPNDGGADHIGVVEKVSNGKITIIEGNKSQTVARRTVSVGWGYIRGYARPKYGTSESSGSSSSNTSSNSSSSSASGGRKLTVDGKWGTDTTLALQYVFNLPIKDGIVSNQRSQYKQAGCYTGWDWKSNPKGSSDLIKAIQKLVGETVDGWIGPNTIKKMQAYWGTVQDGKISAVSDLVKAMQKWVNEKVA